MKRVVNAYTEISLLKKVLLHRPGNEMLNLLPNNMFKYSFNDIPDIEVMQSEHDALANLLRQEGIIVVYLIDLIVDCFNINPNIRDKFIKQYIKEAKIKIGFVYKEIYKFLSSITDNRKLITKCIEGIRCSEINVPNSSFFKINKENSLLIEPLANLCFVHDFIMGIGDSFILSSTKNEIKHRTLILFEYIFKYHPKYKNTKLYNERHSNDLINTSDILIINDEVIMIGLTNNTTSLSVCNIATKILKDKKYKFVIALDVNEKLKSFSLDSLISIIGKDKFLIHNELLDAINIYELGLHNEKLVINSLHMSLDKVLEKYLHLKQVSLLKCSNGNYFDYEKEQLHQAVNVSCIKPDTVVSYELNRITNKHMESIGTRVIKFNSNQFLKGNRGLHSMIVPLIREK